MPEDDPAVAGHQDVRKAIGIEIANRGSVRVPCGNRRRPGLLGHRQEVPLALVEKQSGGPATDRLVVAKSPASGNQHVEVAVTVPIQQADASAERLDDRKIAGLLAVSIGKCQATLAGTIVKIGNRRLRTGIHPCRPGPRQPIRPGSLACGSGWNRGGLWAT